MWNEREAQDPVDAAPREHGLLDHDLALGALEHPPAQRRVLALGVLAHDDHVDVAGPAVGQRRGNPRHQLAGAQVHVLVEAAPELHQRPVERDVVGNERGPADRAVEDRLERRELFEPVVGHHLAVLEVVVAAPVEVLPVELDAEPASGGFEDAQALRNGLLADAVAGNDGDPMPGHASLLVRERRCRRQRILGPADRRRHRR